MRHVAGTAVLLDRRLFQLAPKAYKAFTIALDKSPTTNPKLLRLLASRAPGTMSDGEKVRVWQRLHTQAAPPVYNRIELT
jgi:uncharacterized protein DUF1778